MLVKQTITQFVETLASNAPAPGGGSVAALNGSLGTALTNMVAELTVGKEKYAEFEELNQKALAELKIILDKFQDLIDKDTDAYNVVSAAFTLPKETDEEKAARAAKIQEALVLATTVPFETMETAYKALVVTKTLVNHSNPNAGSDLAVSATNLKSSLQGGYCNVLINIGSVKDEAFRNEYSQKANDLLKKGEALADEIFTEIVSTLQ